MAGSLNADSDRILWMTETDVAAAVSLNEAIDALADMLSAEARGEAGNVDKALGTWSGHSSMHALGAQCVLKGYVGFKTWANTPQGAAAVFSLFSTSNGQLLAMLEAGALGQMRTAGISGLATRALALPQADEMAVIGTGGQSLMQVAAVVATRRLKRLRFYSRTPERRAAFLQKAREALPFEVIEATSVEAAVHQVPIVTLITRTHEPFLHAAMLSRGAHVNAAGAILPGHAEFHQDVFERASLVVVDSLANARKASTEFRLRYGEGPGGWEQVKTLGSLLAEQGGRPANADVTLFKPMGMGLSDLAVAVAAYERALETGEGTWMPRGSRTVPRWQPAKLTF
jgi:alanine dehydrogenase